jgi:hypothetical protein
VIISFFEYHWLAPKVLSFGKTKEKRVFLLFFAHLFVPLAGAESTFVRKNKRKKGFSFVFRSLIRTFAADINTTVQVSEVKE